MIAAAGSAALRGHPIVLQSGFAVSKACKPAVRPLHRPPVLTQPLAALNASSGNPANDAPLPQVGSASLEVVAFVGVQLCRSSTGTSWQASNRRNRFHAPLEHLGVVPVRAADQDHQWDASGIYDDVPLGAELASVRGVWARFLAPRLGKKPNISAAKAEKVLGWQPRPLKNTLVDTAESLLKEGVV